MLAKVIDIKDPLFGSIVIAEPSMLKSHMHCKILESTSDTWASGEHELFRNEHIQEIDKEDLNSEIWKQLCE